MKASELSIWTSACNDVTAAQIKLNRAVKRQEALSFALNQIDFSKLEWDLNKLGLSILGLPSATFGKYDNYNNEDIEAAKLVLTLRVVGINPIADCGYNSRGEVKNEKALRIKAQKLSEKIETATGCKASIWYGAFIAPRIKSTETPFSISVTLTF